MASSEIYMLTTEDNPYSPFTQFLQWQGFDHYKGYYTMEYLARIAHTSPELSDDVNLGIIDAAIDEIVGMNLIGIYKKVKESDFKS